MRRDKLKDLIFLAGNASKLPETIIVESMEVEKYIYLQDDTLNPVILMFANFISNKVFKEDYFNIPIKKSEESLCFGIIDEDGKEELDDFKSETIRCLILMEAMNMIFNLKSKNKIDLTSLIVNWRKSLNNFSDGKIISFNDNTNGLIINNINSIKNKSDKRLINE